MIRGQYVEHGGHTWVLADVSSHRNYTSGLSWHKTVYTLESLDGAKRVRLTNPTAEQINLTPECGVCGGKPGFQACTALSAHTQVAS